VREDRDTLAGNFPQRRQMSTEAIRSGSEIVRGFANGRAGGRIAGRGEELKRRTPLSIRPLPFRPASFAAAPIAATSVLRNGKQPGQIFCLRRRVMTLPSHPSIVKRGNWQTSTCLGQWNLEGACFDFFSLVRPWL
jgi:hypothetical protein